MEMPAEQKKFLSREDYESKSDITKQESQVKRIDPYASVFK